MKYILFILLLIVGVGCNQEEAPKKRFFFVGYNATDSYGSSNGNLYYKLDTLPTNEQLRQDVYEMHLCDRPYRKEHIIIVSISEFKDSLECIKFKGLPESPLPNCDTTELFIIKGQPREVGVWK